MSPAISAALVSALAAAPLVLGAWIELTWKPSERIVGYVAAFGAGALISAVSYELVLDAVGAKPPIVLAIAMASGACVYFGGDWYLDSRSSAHDASTRGFALLMGAALDGIPESFILGISLIAGSGVSVPFLMAVIVSNLPEGMASAAELKDDPEYPTRRILSMWAVVVLISALVGAGGAIVAARGTASGAMAQAFAAGALLTMLIDDLIPEAREKGSLGAGLAGVLGFAVAFSLHQLGG